MEDWYSVPGIVVPANTNASLVQSLTAQLGSGYSAAISVSIKPKSFAFRAPWKILDPNLLIGECRVKYLGKRYSAFLYFSRPQNPVESAPAAETVDLLCPPFDNIGPGSPVVLQLKHSQIICI